MSWRASSGRDTDVCNRCRKVPDMGAPLYVGEVAKANWCESCARDCFGKSPDGPVQSVRDLSPMGRIDASGLLEKLRANLRPERSWTGENE